MLIVGIGEGTWLDGPGSSAFMNEPQLDSSLLVSCLLHAGGGCKASDTARMWESDGRL